MRTEKGLLLKDWGLLKSQGKGIIYVMIGGAALMVGALNNSVIDREESAACFGIYITVTMAIYVANMLAYDEMDHGFQYLFSLPTGVKKLLDVLPSMDTIQQDMIPSTETLKSGVRLQRMGKLRILNLVDTSSAADGTIVNLAASDRPANYVFAPAIVRGQTYPDFFISVTPVSAGTGKVGLFRGANVQMQYNGYICSQIAWLVD